MKKVRRMWKWVINDGEDATFSFKNFDSAQEAIAEAPGYGDNIQAVLVERAKIPFPYQVPELCAMAEERISEGGEPEGGEPDVLCDWDADRYFHLTQKDQAALQDALTTVWHRWLSSVDFRVYRAVGVPQGRATP